MKVLACIFSVLVALTVCASAAEVPREVTRAMPESARALLSGEDFSQIDGGSLAGEVSAKAQAILRQHLRGVVSILLAAVLCGAADGFRGMGKLSAFLPAAGALCVTLISAGSLDDLIGLGVKTIRELDTFSKALLPVLAVSMAASGHVSAGAFGQVTTVFLTGLIMHLMDQLLIPLIYLYIGMLTAAVSLSDARLEALAEGVKKAVTWLLTTVMLVFTIYLSVGGILAGSADGAAVKVAKAAVSSAIPVVGSILSDVSESVLAGAGAAKNTVGVFGMLVILAACMYPFLHLGIQYLLYKLTAFLAAAVGAPGIGRLVGGLGGAFGLVLGMTGSCAVVMLVSVLSAVAAVTP